MPIITIFDNFMQELIEIQNFQNQKQISILRESLEKHNFKGFPKPLNFSLIYYIFWFSSKTLLTKLF